MKFLELKYFACLLNWFSYLVLNPPPWKSMTVLYFSFSLNESGLYNLKSKEIESIFLYMCAETLDWENKLIQGEKKSNTKTIFPILHFSSL